MKKSYTLKIVGGIVALFILMEALTSLAFWYSYESKKAFILDRNIKIFNDVYLSTRQGYRKISRLIYDEIINKPGILAIFKKANDPAPAVSAEARRQLYEALLPTYRSLQNVNLRQLHFHLPDNRSFLRFHRPQKFGDDLTGIRFSVELANRDKQYIEGFEEGRIFNGFRHVYPLFDAWMHHLGSVEISLSSEALRGDIENITGSRVDFVVNKKYVERKVWKEEWNNYYQSDISPDYYYERSGKEQVKEDTRYQKIKAAIETQVTALMKTNRPFSLYEEGYIVSFLPIANVKGEAGVAYLISYNETNAVSVIRNDLLVTWAFSSMGVVIIAVLGFMLAMNIAQTRETATRDGLTGLLNRNSLLERINLEMARSQRSDKRFSLIYLDVDNFKRINDSFGHERGDNVLKQLAGLLQANTRESDSVGRWGGEEFLICLPDTNVDNAKIVAEKLRRKISADDFGFSEKITCSFGVTVYRKGEPLTDVVGRADRYLYEAKAGGKNRVKGL